jgi:hypothetical protein
MKFFPNPEKAAEKVADKKLADAVASREATAARLAAAQGAVAGCRAILHQLALQGADDAALAGGEAKLLDAERRVSTLAPALAEIDALVTTLEAHQAKMLHEKTCVAVAAYSNGLADEMTEMCAAYLASTAAFNEVCIRALAVTQEANGMTVFTASSLIEVAAATPVVAECLRQHGRAVLNGLAKAEMPKPAALAPKVVPAAKEALTRLFATRAVRWRDADGAERCSGKFLDVDVNAAQAKRALASGAALPISDPARRANLGSWPGHVSLSQCFDLDAATPSVDAGPLQHDPVVHSAFTPVDRGPAFKLRVATS